MTDALQGNALETQNARVADVRNGDDFADACRTERFARKQNLIQKLAVHFLRQFHRVDHRIQRRTASTATTAAKVFR